MVFHFSDLETKNSSFQEISKHPFFRIVIFSVKEMLMIKA
jgi:hypothetical protein